MMGLKVTWEIACDGCKKKAKNTIILTEETEEQHRSWYDIWGPGIPEGWIQKAFDEKTQRHYLFFCSDACIIVWYEKQGRIEDIERFKGGVCIA